MSFFFLFFIHARGLFGQPIHGLIESYLPPSKEKIASTDNIYNENNINWIYDFDEAIAVSEMTGKSMFVNFTDIHVLIAGGWKQTY